MDKVNKDNVQKRLKELIEKKPKSKREPVPEYSIAAEPESLYNGKDEEMSEEDVLRRYLSLSEKQSKLTTQIKEEMEELDKKTLAKYPTLTEDEVKQLVVDDKRLESINISITSEMERISQRLALRIKELAVRYEATLPQHNIEVAALEEKVNAHLIKMGFEWK